MILLVTYDLRTPSHDYSKLNNELKQAEQWWHYIDSTWLIQTRYDPEEWYRRLVPQILQNDSLLIIEVKPNYQGWLPQEAWAWIQQRLY